MLRAAPGLRPIGIFEEMIRRHPELGHGIRRTLERRIRAWRAVHGAEREVIFRQTHRPRPHGPVRLHRHGQLRRHRRRRAPRAPALSLPPRLFRLRTRPCRARRRKLRRAWRKACKTPCGRSAGRRSSTAATASRPLSAISIGRRATDLTRRYDDLCAHYGMTPTRNNNGVAHENGSVESSHGHLKAPSRTRC